MNLNEGDTIMLITETHVLVLKVQSVKLRPEFKDSNGIDGIVTTITKNTLPRA